MVNDRWRSLAVPGGMAVLLLAAAIAVWLLARGRHDEIATLIGHSDGVYSLALAPGGTPQSALVASGGGEGDVRLWDLQSRQQKTVLRGHVGRVLATAWSPDESMIATGGADRSIRLWNAKTGEELAVWANQPKPVKALAFSGRGKWLAAAIDKQVYIWSVDNRHEPRVFPGHTQPISGLAFVPGTSKLITFASDKTVLIWDLSVGKQVARMPGPAGHCYGLTLSADGKLAACLGGGRVHLYDVVQGRALDPVEPNAHILCGAAFSPDGKTIAIGSQDGYIVIWDIQQKRELTRLQGHQFAVGQMAFLPDGKTLVTSSHDGTLKLWKVN